jgi:lactaldehyde dehydrogenase/glycolaldehyde dehydrogenase
MQKEIFGPVAPIHVFYTLDEAIQKANDSIYGLTSSLYTFNLAAAMQACNEIQTGKTYINRENFEAIQGFYAGGRC